MKQFQFLPIATVELHTDGSMALEIDWSASEQGEYNDETAEHELGPLSTRVGDHLSAWLKNTNSWDGTVQRIDLGRLPPAEEPTRSYPMNTNTLTDREFADLGTATIHELTDDQLARAYTRAVLLNHRARMEGQRFARNRDASLPLPERTQNLVSRLNTEIHERGKVWQVGLTGDSWLDDKP